MHCPRCGQQQISDQTKFCSRCGFQLGLVVQLLEHGGFLPQLNELYKNDQGLFTRKNGVIASIVWFIVFVMMMPAFFGIADVEEAAAASAVFGVFSTIILLIISLAFLPSSKKRLSLPAELDPANAPGLYGNPAMHELPPQQSQPVSNYSPPVGGWRADTSDLARPGSVTEGTTRLLHKDEE
ncbi:MAG: zinc ribbon domain-containing protein [Acidobacteriota bacterium]